MSAGPPDRDLRPPHPVVLIPGDGIGPEISAAAVAVLDAAGAPLAWQEHRAGEAARVRDGDPLPAATLAAIRAAGVALKGPLVAGKQSGGVTVRREDGTAAHYPSVNNALRRELALYANVRPIRSFPGVPGAAPGLDVVVVREVTEDVYVGWEEMVGPDEARAIKRITRRASERIFRHAFEHARREGRRRVTAGHKANVLHLTDGLFLECGRAVAREYPDVAFDDLMVDALCLALVRAPERLDVVVLPNQYGDIVSDLCAGLAGSLGLAPGANLGDAAAVFEATHGAAPDIAGRGIANPIALILSGAMLLGHIGERAAERRVRDAVARVLREGRWLTPDLGGTAGTAGLARAITGALAS
jgi:isocitrate dehydrogenase (NAD+)